ncbi:MAG TPA: hypothetical protein VJ508_05170, partial [Saprospiraceae bacterium]|nr:hypothetical protein [Saprospiraceae bacterium]
MIRFYIPFAGLLLFVLPLSGQQTAKSTLLDEIAFQADVMVNATADQHRARAHEAMVRDLDSLLSLPDSYTISFDSIPWLSVLHGDDFRLVTW